MNVTVKRPGIGRIVSTDYAALLGAIFPAVGVGLWIANLFGFPGSWRGRPVQPNAPAFVWIALGFSILGIVLLTTRVKSVWRMFAVGQRVPGTVTAVWFDRDRGRVEFSFEHAGNQFSSGNALHKTARTAALRPGMNVTILVDPTDPKRALLLDLYT